MWAAARPVASTNSGAMACRLPWIRANIAEVAKMAMIGDVCLSAIGRAMPRKIVSSIMGAMTTASKMVVDCSHSGEDGSENISRISCDSRGI